MIKKCPQFFPRSIFIPKSVANKPMLDITDKDLAQLSSNLFWKGRDTVNLSSAVRNKSAFKKVLEKLGLGEDATFIDTLKRRRESAFRTGRITISEGGVNTLGEGVKEGYFVNIKG